MIFTRSRRADVDDMSVKTLIPLSQMSVILASYTHWTGAFHSKIGGPAISLRDFLCSKIDRLVCIWQPLAISSDLALFVETFKRGRLQQRSRYSMFPRVSASRKEIGPLYFWLKVRDAYGAVRALASVPGRSDIFIGVESLNAMLGVAFRKLGKIRRVIYYNLDYGHRRFDNPILNSLFHTFDKFCVRYCDCVWNLTPVVEKARELRAATDSHRPIQITVPIGTEFERIKRLTVEEIPPKTVVYLGLLTEKQGVQILPGMLPYVAKEIPDVRLIIIGDGGPYERILRAGFRKNGVSSLVSFITTFDPLEIESILCKCAVGLAPYFPAKDSTKRFGDVTKPKIYMACGLPVVITPVPPIAKEIQLNSAGVVAGYDEAEFASAIVKLLVDRNYYKACKKSATKMAETFSWETIFAEAFARTAHEWDLEA